MKLANRISLLTFALAVVPLAVAGWSIYNIVGPRWYSDIVAHLDTVNHLMASDYDRWIKANKVLLQSRAQRPSMSIAVASLLGGDETGSDVDRIGSLRELHLEPALGIGSFLEVFILDADSGRVLVSTDPDSLGRIERDSDYFEASRSGTAHSSVRYELHLQQYAKYIAAPIRGPGGETIAILVGNLDWREALRIFTDPTADGYRHRLLNRDRFNVLNDPAQQPFIRYQDAIAQRCTSGEDGQAVIVDTAGVERLAVMQWLPEFGLCITSEERLDRATESMTRSRNLFVAVFLLAALAALVAGLYFARRLSLSLAELSERAEALLRSRGGSTDVGWPDDEVGDVGRVLQRAVDKLHAVTASRDALDAEVSRRVQVEQALRDSNRELEQFAYIASHDLQEPLRVIGSFVDLLRRRYHDKLDSDANEFIDFAVDGSRRMQGMIDGLLQYSRVSTRGAEFADVSLDEVMGNVADDLDHALTEGGVRLERRPLPVVRGDALQLERVLMNLVGNACKFSVGRPEPTITVDCDDSDPLYWRINVRDNGIGVAAESQERIFDMFHRLHRDGSYPGQGIGLAISKRIVTRHGGDIGVESEPDRGSVFWFRLPRTTPGGPETP